MEEPEASAAAAATADDDTSAIRYVVNAASARKGATSVGCGRSLEVFAEAQLQKKNHAVMQQALAHAKELNKACGTTFRQWDAYKDPELKPILETILDSAKEQLNEANASSPFFSRAH